MIVYALWLFRIDDAVYDYSVSILNLLLLTEAFFPSQLAVLSVF